jgi:hypothetical protein
LVRVGHKVLASVADRSLARHMDVNRLFGPLPVLKLRRCVVRNNS